MAKRPPQSESPIAATRRPHSSVSEANLGPGTSEDKRASGGNVAAYPARTPGPLKITPMVLEAICERLADGSPLGAACYLEGVAPQSLRELGQRNPAVAMDVERARALGSEMLRKRALTGEVSRTCEWMLERLYPRDYSPPAQKQEITGKDGGPIEQSGGLQVTITDAKRIIRERRAKGESK